MNSKWQSIILVTDDSLGGIVDVHDRRPVAVRAEDARRWLDPAITVEEADDIARTAMLDAELFEWYQVSRMLNVGGDGPEMAVRLEPTDAQDIDLPSLLGNDLG